MSRILSATLALLHLLCFAVPVGAQESAWSAPEPFFRIHSGSALWSPRFVTDSAGQLHAFWPAAMSSGERVALYYSRWDGSAWQEPTDVLLSPDGVSMQGTVLVIDQDDFIHAFWPGSADVWHSQAHASVAGTSLGWSRPDPIPVSSKVGLGFTVVLDREGAWHLVYVNSAYNVVSTRRSTDDMSTWLPEVGVHYEGDPNTLVMGPGLTLVPNGETWIWWAELDPKGSGTGNKGAKLAKSMDGGQTWGPPEQVVSGYYSMGFSAEEDIVIKWVAGGLGVGGRYISFSQDSGASWTSPVNISSGNGDGMQGVSWVVDSAGVWHFLEQTADTFATVAWDGVLWYPLEFVVPLDILESCCIAPGQVTQNAVIAVSEGNRLHVIFDQGAHTLWYSSRLLPVPKLPARTLSYDATLVASPKDALDPLQRQSSVSAREVAANERPGLSVVFSASESTGAVLWGVLCTALFLGAFCLIRLRNRRS